MVQITMVMIQIMTMAVLMKMLMSMIVEDEILLFLYEVNPILKLITILR